MGPVVVSLAAGVAVLLFGMLVNSCQIDKLLGNGRSATTPEQPAGQSGALEVTPSSLKDSALFGAPELRRSSIQITNTGRWTAESDSDWIVIAPTSGSGPRLVTVTLNPDGLRAGSHDGAVTVSAPDAIGSPVTVAVKFVLQQPILSVKPSSLNHSTVSSNRRYYDTLDVRNDGTGPLVWAASNASTWLSVKSPTGAGPGKLAITMSTEGLPVGTHRDTIVVTAAAAVRSPLRIPVELRRRHDN